MARSAMLCLLFIFCVGSVMVEGNAGRKLLQGGQGRTDATGATTAGISTTQSNIEKVTANPQPTKPGDKPPQLAKTKPLPAVANRPAGQGPKTSQGSASQGAAENAQAATSASITTTTAMGSKPVKKEAPKPDEVTKMIPTAPKTMQGTAMAGAATNMQAATAAAINTAADTVAAVKPVPGRQTPRP